LSKQLKLWSTILPAPYIFLALQKDYFQQPKHTFSK
jgi:hypothetical protein